MRGRDTNTTAGGSIEKVSRRRRSKFFPLSLGFRLLDGSWPLPGSLFSPPLPRRLTSLSLAFCLALSACSAPPPPMAPGLPAAAVGMSGDPERQYAGQVLSFVLQVVLGRAGAPGQRQAWRTVGRDHPLDLAAIQAAMTAPEGNKAAVMVYDANLIGLFQVLYRYDHSLNLYGQHNLLSLYPSAEMIALRLMLLQKTARGEPIHLGALWQRRSLLSLPNRPPTASDLKATNLNRTEFELLRAVVARQPRFLDYLRHPFIVEALQRIGAVADDPLVGQLAAQATYAPVAWPPLPPGASGDPVRIAILPSLSGDFQASAEDGATMLRLVSTMAYRQAVARLQKAIHAAVKRRLAGRRRLDQNLSRIVFSQTSGPPMVIYPQNIEKVVAQTAGSADFVIVVLGKDVYLALGLTPEADGRASVPRAYVDISDIRYPDLIAPVAARVADIAIRRLALEGGRPERPAAAPA